MQRVTGSFPLEAKRNVLILKYWSWTTYVKELLSNLCNTHSELWLQQTRIPAKLPVQLIETTYKHYYYGSQFQFQCFSGNSMSQVQHEHRLIKDRQGVSARGIDF